MNLVLPSLESRITFGQTPQKDTSNTRRGLVTMDFQKDTLMRRQQAHWVLLIAGILQLPRPSYVAAAREARGRLSTPPSSVRGRPRRCSHPSTTQSGGSSTSACASQLAGAATQLDGAWLPPPLQYTRRSSRPLINTARNNTVLPAATSAQVP